VLYGSIGGQFCSKSSLNRGLRNDVRLRRPGDCSVRRWKRKRRQR